VPAGSFRYTHPIETFTTIRKEPIMFKYAHIALVILLTIGVVGRVPSVHAQCEERVAWAAAASTAKLSVLIFNVANASVNIKPSVQPGSYFIRYNIDAVDGVETGHNIFLRAHFKDDGASSQVVLRLFKVAPAGATTPTPVLQATLDSNAFVVPPAPHWQTQTVSAGSSSFFDFTGLDKYFIEAELTKSTSAGDPALSSLQITTGNC
jgi:hypothetical protein